MTSIKEALTDALSGWKYIRTHHGDLYGLGWDRVQSGLEAALAQLDSADARSGNLRRVVLDLLNGVTPAVENLACHQEQADADGCMVKVSRQALDEVLSAVNEVAIQAATSLSTGLLPDASPGNGAVTSSVVAKIEEARDLFWDIKGDFSDPRAECRRGADLLEEVLTALHSTSAAGETTSSADGVIGKDGVTYPDTPLGRAYAGIKPGPSEAIPADVLAMKEACKRAVSECLNQYGRMTFVTEKGWSGLEGQILAAIDKLSPEVKEHNQ